MRIVTVTPSSSAVGDLIPADELQSIVDFSVAHWNDALARCCSIGLEVASAVKRWLAEEDGTNLVVFRRQTWCHNERCGNASTYPPGTLAMTTRYPEGASGSQLREADVEIDGRQLRAIAPDALKAASGERVHVTGRGVWVVSQYADSAPVPLETILVHELGHVLGLDDVCVDGHRASGKPIFGDCAANQRDSVMFAASRKVQPSTADLKELARVYPKPHLGLGQVWLWLSFRLRYCCSRSVSSGPDGGTSVLVSHIVMYQFRRRR